MTIYHDIEPRRQRPPDALPAHGGKWSNDKKRSRNAYPGQGTAPLSAEQKAKLCITAARAFSYFHKREPISTNERETWRRVEQQKAVGRASLTTCTQAHYLPLLAHFEGLAGESGAAYAAHMKAATAPQRVALHKLEEACLAAGKDLSYAAAICKSKFKVGLEEATAKQLWCLVFDMKGRKGAPRAKAAKDAKGKKGPEIDIPF